MYTARLLSDVKNTELRRRIINVEFTDGKNTQNEEFEFKIDETVENMKRIVNQYLDELNFVPPELTDLDYVEPTPTPEPVDTEREQFIKDLNRLIRAKKMAAPNAPILTATQMTNLETKVKKSMKPEYEDLIPLN